jgi:hypothetical protein
MRAAAPPAARQMLRIDLALVVVKLFLPYRLPRRHSRRGLCLSARLPRAVIRLSRPSQTVTMDSAIRPQ